LGGGALGHLGLIIYDAAYAIIAPAGANGPIIWTNPTYSGHAPAFLDQGTVIHSWVEDILTHRTFNTVQQAPKTQIITVLSQCTWTF
jgi:hypothetical protein